ncbi:MAG TPA: (Fe-S)-binding protein [Feifaniaceae bacterium]|nr:(Fe-S)-binding protein [Feifaniaceae bacterium]
MFSEKAKNHADACRFCWMCRHTCPVGLVSGKEGNTPRGRALIISMEYRGIPLSPDAGELIYECCLCGACTNDCATGYDPTIFTREARTACVVEGFVPERVNRVIERAMEGSLFACEPDAALTHKLELLPRQAPTLLYLGDSATHTAPQSALDLMALLELAGETYTALSPEPATGAHLGDLIGYVDEVREMALSCSERMRQTGAERIVVLDPTDARFIKQQWSAWEIPLEAEVVTATAYVADLLKNGRLKPRALGDMGATYHDPCRLARDLDEMEPARAILAGMGVPVKEMFLNRKLTKCCSGCVMQQTNPALAGKIAAARLGDAKEAGARLVVTACPGCQNALAGNAEEGLEVRDIYSLLRQACK